MLQITISKRAALIIGVALVLMVPGIAGATHIFSDVVDGSTHAPGIEWVAENGVSTGCGDGSTYCPNDTVTRAQMGTFMCRLSGNCGVAPSVSAATAGEADTLDGYAANGLIRIASVSVDDNALVSTGGIAATVDIEAPGPGHLIISASSDIGISGIDFDTVTCWVSVNTVQIDASERDVELNGNIGNGGEDCSTDAYFSVPEAGTYTLDFWHLSVGSDTVVDEVVMNAIFVPFGADGS